MYLSFRMLVRQAMQATTFLKPKENANMVMNMYGKSVGENHATVLKSVNYFCDPNKKSIAPYLEHKVTRIGGRVRRAMALQCCHSNHK
jgi:hypothetical protein